MRYGKKKDIFQGFLLIQSEAPIIDGFTDATEIVKSVDVVYYQ